MGVFTPGYIVELAAEKFTPDDLLEAYGDALNTRLNARTAQERIEADSILRVYEQAIAVKTVRDG